ncbi:MAG: alpha/beta hydrolase [Erythrobacter sp.]
MSEDGAILRSEPDLTLGSARPSPVDPELAEFDRQIGGLVTNRFTYRFVRALGRFMRPKVDMASFRLAEVPMPRTNTFVVEPAGAKGTGALFLIHGGGYVIGSTWDVLPKAASFANELGATVVCPSYRLAPQAPFPAALDDCHAAWHALLANAARLGIDPARIVIGGYSAGAGLAACLAQRLRDEGGGQPAAQLLVYPMADDRTATRRELDTPRHRVWSNRNNLFGWSSYLGHGPGQPCPPYAVAARCADLAGLPPTWLGVGTADLFLDEDRAYAKRLVDAGVETTYAEVDGAIHAFDMTETSLAKAFVASQVEFLRRYLA